MKTLRSAALVAATLAFCTIEAVADANPGNRTVVLTIESTSLATALDKWAQQSGYQVFVDSEITKDLTAPALNGRYTARESLEALLSGTPLTYRWLSGKAVSIRKKTSTVPAALQRSEVEQSSIPVAKLSGDGAGAASGGAARKDEYGTPPPRTEESVEEVVVTGTHIHGAVPAGSNFIKLSRADIEKTGFATVQEVIRSLPQNFGGGPGEGTRPQLAGTADPVARTNATSGSAINLRGLGAGATLVLLNGHRMPSGGVSGLFTDVSSIPLSAVERIDVLTDGASAIYGSDAIGGVVNFVLRKDYDGAETRARMGSVTSGDAREYQASQLLGSQWDEGNGLISYEYYQRDALPASARAQSADSDLRGLGGSNFDLPNSNPGTIALGPQTWAIPANQDGTGLQPADFVLGTRNLANTREGMDLLGYQRKHSVFATVEQRLGEQWEIFGEGQFTRRDSETKGAGQATTLVVTPANPFYANPTGGAGPVPISYNLYRDLGGLDSDAQVETYQVTAGTKWSGPADWRVAAYGQLAREDQTVIANELNPVEMASALADPNPATAFNPFGDGSFTNPATLARLEGHRRFEATSDIESGNLTADGAVFRVPGGEARLAIGVNYRQESFESSTAPPVGATLRASYERDITAEFVELFVPLVGADSARPGTQRLELSLAGRHESYSDFGSTTNPKFGVAWRPFESLTLRGTWGKSFKAPYLADLDETNNVNFIFRIPDPQAGGTSPVLISSGGNADLEEERATAWTAGLEWSPPTIDGLSVGATYFDIDYKDRVAQAPNTFNWLSQPEFADIVIRNPTPEQRERFCSSGIFAGNLGGVPGDCRSAAVAAIIDLRNNNVAITRNTGVDLATSYAFNTAVGSFTVGLNATRLREFSEAARPTSRPIERLDTAGYPLETRVRAMLTWAYRSLSSTLFANHANSYRDNVSVPNRSIDSWTTIDLQLAYEGRTATVLDGTRVALTAQNLFDKDPPFFNNPVGIGFDPTNADLRGRFVSLMLQKQW